MTSRFRSVLQLAVVAIGSTTVVTLFSIVTLRAQLPGNPVPENATISAAPGALMRAKLTASQELLEGLIRKDFDQVSKGAERMKKISEAAEWPRARDAVYEHFAAEFRRQCNELAAMATDRNSTGVKFAYLNLTATCVNCHDYVRDSLRVADVRRHGDVTLIPAEWPADAAAPRPNTAATPRGARIGEQTIRR